MRRDIQPHDSLLLRWLRQAGAAFALIWMSASFAYGLAPTNTRSLAGAAPVGPINPPEIAWPRGYGSIFVAVNPASFSALMIWSTAASICADDPTSVLTAMPRTRPLPPIGVKTLALIPAITNTAAICWDNIAISVPSPSYETTSTSFPLRDTSSYRREIACSSERIRGAYFASNLSHSTLSVSAFRFASAARESACAARSFAFPAASLAADKDSARALPPLRPPLRPSETAAGSLPCSSGVGSRSSTAPVATSTMRFAH